MATIIIFESLEIYHYLPSTDIPACKISTTHYIICEIGLKINTCTEYVRIIQLCFQEGLCLDNRLFLL